MLNLAGIEHVYLACGSTDLRKSIDGLAATVSQVFKLDPFSPCLFVFCNRQRDKLKILYWDWNGFWLVYRRLEKGRFRWPSTPPGETLTINRRQLQWLLDGLELDQKQAHPVVHARVAI
jgi:transposase